MNSIKVSGIYSAYEALNSQKSSAPDKPKKTENKKDEVAISEAAKDYGTVSKILSSLPDIRSGVIAGIKAAYQSGSYNIPSEDIASSIINKWASLD